MKRTCRLFTLLLLVCVLGFTACNNNAGSKEDVESQAISENEESAWDLVDLEAQLLKTDVYDDTISGVHVMVKYMLDDKYFYGSLENVGDEHVVGLKLGMHLSNGMDLGPSHGADLEPGKAGSVVIDADIKEWEKWAVYVEIGDAEGGE